MENIKIFKATSKDAQGIQDLTNESSKGMYELCGWSPEEIANHFNPETTKEAVAKLKKAITDFTERDILFVAKDNNNKIVGCCLAEKQTDKNTIEAVYVLPEFQGKRLAQRLYNEAYKLLDPNKNTFLDVFSSNSKAIKFYKKQGFSETGKKTFDKKFANFKGEMLEITEMILLK